VIKLIVLSIFVMLMIFPIGYPGKEAFEALEAKHLATWMKNLTTEGNTKLLGYLDFHSYSQQSMYPQTNHVSV